MFNKLEKQNIQLLKEQIEILRDEIKSLKEQIFEDIKPGEWGGIYYRWQTTPDEPTLKAKVDALIKEVGLKIEVVDESKPKYVKVTKKTTTAKGGKNGTNRRK